MQCYGIMGSCCNFYDEDDNCLADCSAEMNMVADENYTCICQGFYGPPGDCSGKFECVCVCVCVYIYELIVM